MDKNFGGIVWTNHALQRLTERGIQQGDAWATWRNPDQTRYAKSKGAWVYYKTYGKTKIEVVATKSQKGEWIILSVWSRSVDDRFEEEPVESLLNLIVRRIFKRKRR